VRALGCHCRRSPRLLLAGNTDALRFERCVSPSLLFSRLRFLCAARSLAGQGLSLGTLNFRPKRRLPRLLLAQFSCTLGCLAFAFRHQSQFLFCLPLQLSFPLASLLLMLHFPALAFLAHRLHRFRAPLL